MKGTRPLDNNEITLVSACFDGAFAIRNRGIFMLGVSTGGRISELLSLTIGDVYQNEKPVTDMLFDKSVVKGGEVSRAVPVNLDGRLAIAQLVDWHRERYDAAEKSRPLFPSRQGKTPQPMSRRTAHNVLKAAFIAAGLNGHLATHSLRKSFAQRVYDRSGDIFMVQELLGHRNVATTQKYLGMNYASARQACEEISVSSDMHTTSILGMSLKKSEKSASRNKWREGNGVAHRATNEQHPDFSAEADETLFLELALRGYDLSRRRDHDTEKGEVVKIS